MDNEKKELLVNWIKLKKAEDKAKNARYAIEKEIEKLYQLKEKEKSKIFKEIDLGFSVNVKHNVSTKLDQEKYKTIRLDIPENLRPEKIEYKIDTKGLEYLKENEKDIYIQISNCITITPGKTGITVSKI